MEQERLIFHVDVNSAFLSWEAVRRVKEGPVSYTHLDVYKRQILWSAHICIMVLLQQLTVLPLTKHLVDSIQELGM